MYRTHNCGELRQTDVNKTVTLAGWLSNTRDLGQVIFFVLRDFYGITQVLANTPEFMEQIRNIPLESTVQITGTVIMRTSPNANLPTGLIEILPASITVLGKCVEPLPFEIAKSLESREDVRLKYRFLDLRNEINKNKIILRSNVIKALRDKMYELGFFEYQTPILTSSSPEGARDYLVPSRVYPGQFYALPQAPQQFKQLLMTSGFDRYFQIAPCFRDEDSRADRSPGEFYQLDVEMAFASQEDVFAVMEQLLPPIFSKFGQFTASPAPFKRIKYSDAINLYGTDKPDLRNPLLYSDVTDLALAAKIPFFAHKFTKAIVVKNCKQSRKEIESITTEFKTDATTLSWLKLDETNALVGGIGKFFTDANKTALIKTLELQANDVVFFVNVNNTASKTLGVIRNEIGARFDLLKKGTYEFCWIVDFCMYEFDEENNKIDFSHNPFSMPQGGLDALKTKNPLDILAYQYDIVCNGIELSSGAVRNHDPEIMIEAFKIAGYDESVITNKFPALYNAFKYGAPPHAGIAPGVDRMVMLLANEPNIREVIAFPLNKNARDLLMNAPCEVTEKQLREANIKIR